MAGDRGRVKVSVIIPVYNSEKYLKECLDSVASQSLQDIEVICVDNASTDNSGKIVHEYCAVDPRFMYIRNERNRGQAYSRNIGLSKANGIYIYFVDSDDMLRPNALSNLCKYMEKDKLEGMLFDAEVIYEQEGEICATYISHRKQLYRNIKDGKEIFSALVNNGEYTAVVWRQFWSALFLKENNVKFFEQASPHEDLLFTFQALLAAKRVKCISDSYYIYRKHVGAITAGRASWEQIRARFVAYVEILMICRTILSSDDRDFGYAILDYLASEGQAIVHGMNGLLRDGYSLEKVAFKDPFYDMYFRLFLGQANSLLNNYSVEKLCHSLSSRSRIIVYGAGVIGQRAMRLLEMLGHTNYTVAVTDNSGCQTDASGKHIYNIEELREFRDQSLVIIATAKRHQAAMMQTLRRLGFLAYLCIT